MAKLWQKNYDLNSVVETFTVGRDYLLDQDILVADCVASLAHAQQLVGAGILTQAEFEQAAAGLKQVIRDFRAGAFAIQRSDEDCHTAIENRLTETVGEVGKKIHTGRSRNDQVVTALRVFGRSSCQQLWLEGLTLASDLLAFARKHQNVPMPGRTHMQIAMPSSVGLWAGAFAEEILDTLKVFERALEIFNQGSLGSAAGYGVPLPLDRALTARLLGFPKVQNNVIYVSNSRGKFEAFLLDCIDQLGLTLSKMATELILFTLPEFGYFRLPPQLTTGSSIMPQKKNPDGLELMRAKSATLGSYAQQVKNILRSLPAGYNRDFQETKEPFLRGLALGRDCLAIMGLTFRELEVLPHNLAKGFSRDIYATDAAYEMVLAGASFRDAYREVGLNLDKLADRQPESTLANRTHLGAAGNPGFELAEAEIQRQQGLLKAQRTATLTALDQLLGESAEALTGL